MASLSSSVDDEMSSLQRKLAGATKKQLRTVEDSAEQLKNDMKATTASLSKSVTETSQRDSCTDPGVDVEGGWLQTVGDIMKGRFLIIFWAPFCATVFGVIYLGFLNCCSRCMMLFSW